MFKRLIKRYKNEIMIISIVFLFIACIVCCHSATDVKSNTQINKVCSAAEPTAAVIEQQPAEPTKEPQQEQPQYTEVTLTATAYCPCVKCCGKSDGITATAGRTIAADPSVFPYGTRMLIYGKEYTVEDCGGGVKGNHLKVFTFLQRTGFQELL